MELHHCPRGPGQLTVIDSAMDSCWKMIRRGPFNLKMILSTLANPPGGGGTESGVNVVCVEVDSCILLEEWFKHICKPMSRTGYSKCSQVSNHSERARDVLLFMFLS